MKHGSDSSVWTAILDTPLSVDEAIAWATLPDCGAVVSFCGTVRDFSEGRPTVSTLEYEAYTSVAQRKLDEVAQAARAHWKGVRRVALLHRVGTLNVGDVAVVVVVATPHRDEAFAAAQFCIDTLKETVPIWKRETWAQGREWAVESIPSTGVTIPALNVERSGRA